MNIVNTEVTNFIRTVQPMYDGSLGQIQRECELYELPAISQETARLLGVLLAIVKPKDILEVGCAAGFSSALMARYAAPDGHITTIDRYDIMIEQAKRNFKRFGLEDKITLLEGDALEILKKLESAEKRYDVIFLDAAKGQYIQFLPICLKLLNVGGLLIADDVLQEGRIAKERLAVPRRQRTIHTRMRDFLHAISNTKGLESCILPFSDGVCVCYKTQEITGADIGTKAEEINNDED